MISTLTGDNILGFWDVTDTVAIFIHTFIALRSVILATSDCEKVNMCKNRGWSKIRLVSRIGRSGARLSSGKPELHSPTCSHYQPLKISLWFSVSSHNWYLEVLESNYWPGLIWTSFSSSFLWCNLFLKKECLALQNPFVKGTNELIWSKVMWTISLESSCLSL